MSRSYKKNPFMAICGDCSAKKDKQLAHRCERRTYTRVVRLELINSDFEDFVLPHRRECAHNNVWSWNRDGKQRYMAPSLGDWEDYLNGEDTWPPSWFNAMMRK